MARVGEDYPAHHVFRAAELRASRAAFAAGLSPETVYDEPGIMIVRYLNARAYGEEDVRADSARCVEMVKRCHTEMPKRMTGPGAIFWVFHVLRDYGVTLKANNHRHAGDFPRWLAICSKLEEAQVALPIIFGHHDLLPANFLEDGRRLWLIDWEYGAYGTAMFDLSNIAVQQFIRAAGGRGAAGDLFRPAADGSAVALLRCHEDGIGAARSSLGDDL